MKYYRLLDDVNIENRWYLGDIQSVDNWALTSAIPLKETPEPLHVDVYQYGIPLDFTLTEVYSIPIVSHFFLESVGETIKGVHFYPINIIREGRQFPLNHRFYFMQIEKIFNCIDEKKSEFSKFTKNDPIRPDKAGQYRNFSIMKIKEGFFAEPNIFRVKGFKHAIIINEIIAEKCKNLKGIRLAKV